ncbi:hypothetical protein DFJ43DRAFT_1227199 [Lentinula guzmanii]|uniref:Uncharacterized protein n=1 Tax=Lentinula guzmanii TaxID=2804957 RepID=A0AA38MX39_9AGAR|nr:hypothetical protein DFJ43DRAFT_1227199 [Lentinula guzmanii]
MRFTLTYLVLGLATAAYAAPTNPPAPQSVEVKFLDNFAGSELSTPLSVIEPEKVQKGLDRIIKKYASKGSSKLPKGWQFRIMNEFNDDDVKGFKCAMKGFGQCVNGYWCHFTVLYDESKPPILYQLVPDS